MAYIKIQPPGVMPLKDEDRQSVIKVIGGDSWTLDVNLFNPLNPSEPADPDTTIVRFALAETQFEQVLWEGEWYKGVYPDSNRKDLQHIVIPRSITKALRRGSYMFSIRVCDVLKSVYRTEGTGSFLVEYTPTSDQHSIPYKDNISLSEYGISPESRSGADWAAVTKELEEFKQYVINFLANRVEIDEQGEMVILKDAILKDPGVAIPDGVRRVCESIIDFINDRAKVDKAEEALIVDEDMVEKT